MEMATESINLTEHQAAFIRERVDSGDFHDASEVVRAGIRLLQNLQAEKLEQEEELRTILIEAKKGGVSNRTPEEVWASVRARHEVKNA